MPWNAHRKSLLLFCCLCAVARGQAPDAELQLPERPTNLRVLPKETPVPQIGRLMKQYRDELGVTCRYCHAENPQTQKLDYASDDNPAKQTARVMIAMTSDINNKYMAQLGDRRYVVPITCGICHQGQSNPPPFDPR
jgi:hypothetical protein